MCLCVFVCGLTAAFARWDGRTLVFDVQSAGCVEDGVDKDVRLTHLKHFQHLLQEQAEGMGEKREGGGEWT